MLFQQRQVLWAGPQNETICSHRCKTETVCALRGTEQPPCVTDNLKAMGNMGLEEECVTRDMGKPLQTRKLKAQLSDPHSCGKKLGRVRRPPAFRRRVVTKYSRLAAWSLRRRHPAPSAATATAAEASSLLSTESAPASLVVAGSQTAQHDSHPPAQVVSPSRNASNDAAAQSSASNDATKAITELGSLLEECQVDMDELPEITQNEIQEINPADLECFRELIDNWNVPADLEPEDSSWRHHITSPSIFTSAGSTETRLSASGASRPWLTVSGLPVGSTLPGLGQRRIDLCSPSWSSLCVMSTGRADFLATLAVPSACIGDSKSLPSQYVAPQSVAPQSVAIQSVVPQSIPAQFVAPQSDATQHASISPGDRVKERCDTLFAVNGHLVVDTCNSSPVQGLSEMKGFRKSLLQECARMIHKKYPSITLKQVCAAMKLQAVGCISHTSTTSQTNISTASAMEVAEKSVIPGHDSQHHASSVFMSSAARQTDRQKMVPCDPLPSENRQDRTCTAEYYAAQVKALITTQKSQHRQLQTNVDSRVRRKRAVEAEQERPETPVSGTRSAEVTPLPPPFLPTVGGSPAKTARTEGWECGSPHSQVQQDSVPRPLGPAPSSSRSRLPSSDSGMGSDGEEERVTVGTEQRDIYVQDQQDKAGVTSSGLLYPGSENPKSDSVYGSDDEYSRSEWDVHDDTGIWAVQMERPQGTVSHALSTSDDWVFGLEWNQDHHGSVLVM